MRCRTFMVGLSSLFLCAGPAIGSEGIGKIVEAWQREHAGGVQLEEFLQDLVDADPNFNNDPQQDADNLSVEALANYHALQYFFNRTLNTQFLGLSSDALRKEWIRRYWILRDPTPTTERNERLEEHERRVSFARENYAWKDQPYWDARGRIYITFGAPDGVRKEMADVVIGRGFVPAKEDWYYAREGWWAIFEQPIPLGPWVLGRSSMLVSHRPDLVRDDAIRLGLPETAFVAPELRARFNEVDPDRLASDDALLHEAATSDAPSELGARYAGMGFQQAVEAGLDRFVMPGPPQRPLWFIFDVDVFRGSAPDMRVEVHIQFDLRDLKFKWSDSLYTADYRVVGVLFDRQMAEIARDEYEDTLEASQFRTTLQSILWPGQLDFTVPAGDYRLALRMEDLASGDRGAYTTRVRVPPRTDGMMMLSDIELATSIAHAGDEWASSRFVKNDRLVVPNPVATYARSKPFVGYVEIYDLEVDTDHMHRYAITYSIVPHQGAPSEDWREQEESSNTPFASSTFVSEAGTSNPVEELRVDIQALEEGRYHLVLDVRDLVGGGEKRRVTPFTILDQ